MTRNTAPVRFAALLLGLAIPSLCVAQQKQPVLFVGRSPAYVYRMVHQAKWAVDADTVLACTSRRAGATPQGVYERLMAERITLAKEFDVLTEEVTETTASVVLEGRRRDRETGHGLVVSRGTITFVKEDGTWRIRQEEWADVGREELPEDIQGLPHRGPDLVHIPGRDRIRCGSVL